MKYMLALLVLLLSACVSSDPELRAQLAAEQDFHANQQYQKDIHDRKAFRPEVYANEEFLSDCEIYKMKECYQ